MKALIKHIELFLSGVGLVIILAVPSLLQEEWLSKWQIAAITATLVGILHGIIFWVIRNRQRQVRNEAISEVKAVLDDVINNNLTIISLVSRMHKSGDSEKVRTAAQETEKAIENIRGALDTISEESVQSWRSRYKTP